MNGFWRSPSGPVALLLLVAPALAVAQFRAMAPAVPVALALALVAAWRARGALPWPRAGAVPMAAGALLGWMLLASSWSPDASRGVGTTLSLAGLVLLGAAAARALEEEPAKHLARIGQALAIGLALGIALLAFDHGSQNLFRRAVRGFPPWSPPLDWALKPAVSVVAVLLPLVLGVALPRLAKGAILAGGLAVALWLPGESAKIAAVLGLLAAFAAMAAPHGVARGAAAALGALFLAAPLIFALVLPRLPDLSPLPFSAQHRIMTWDFVLDRVADRPLLGWGMEASRAIPGGSDTFPPAVLDRFGLTSAEERAIWGRDFAHRLPLHPHNAALQVWLELGLIGAALAALLAALILLQAATPAAIGAAVAAAATGQLSFGVWQPWWIATLVLVAVLAYIQRRTRPL
jgi:O-antigen ligase